MGTVYRRQVRVCTTCDRRLDTTAARQACEAAGHAIDLREQRTWWIKYQVGGRPHCVSSHSAKKADAKRLLKAREGDVVRGVPITASVGRVTFEDAAADLVNDYQTNHALLRAPAAADDHHRRRAGVHGAAPGGRRVERLDQSGSDPAQTDGHARDASGEADGPPLHSAAEGTPYPQGLLRAGAGHEREEPSPSPPAARRRLRVHHRLADAQRNSDVGVASRGHEGRRSSTRPRHHEER